MTIEFFLTSLVIAATPGTGALYTVSAGISRGTRASIVAAFGCTLGTVPHMIAAITGLAAILNASAMAFEIFKYIGVSYLLYLALSTWRDKNVLRVSEESATPVSAGRVIRKGVLVNILNPKLTIFFFAFLPQFVKTGESDARLQMIELSAVFMTITFIVFASYGKFASILRNRIINRPRVLAWMRRGFAGSFAALALLLALNAE